MSGHPFIKALAAYWGGAFVQGLRCHFISMPGKSPMKLEVTSRHDHSCLLGRKASKQTNKDQQGQLTLHGWIWSNFELIKDCTVVLDTCDNDEDPIKNEGARESTAFYIDF